MLSEFLAEPVDTGAFRQDSDSGALLVSTSLEALVCARTASLLDRSAVHRSETVRTWRDAFLKSVIIVRHNTLLASINKLTTFDGISRTCLRIVVLAEYLVTAMGNLFQRLLLERSLQQRWRVVGTEFPWILVFSLST